jgi:hypothetical protein
LKKRECEQQKERWRIFLLKKKKRYRKKKWRGRVTVKKRERRSEIEGDL